MSASTFDLRPLMAANMACTMAMMAFVSLIGPIARVLGLATWQAGAAVTVSGVIWMVLARPWGQASDRFGRRRILLLGTAGFTLAFGPCACSSTRLYASCLQQRWRLSGSCWDAG